MKFLDKNLIPNWFEFPKEYLLILELNLTNLKPWCLCDGKNMELSLKLLKESYPGIDIFPFALKKDSDDFACWIKEGGNTKVYVLHDNGMWGWKKRIEYKSFWDWYRRAVEDMIEFHD